MAHQKVFATQSGRYGTRMLVAGDPLTLTGPQARVLTALGRVTSDKPKRKVEEPADERPALRAAYKDKFGKAAFNGWDADTLREKIAAAE